MLFCKFSACAKRAELKVLQLRTAAKGARFIWAASRLTRRDGTLPGGSPERVSLQLKLGGLVFWVVEYAVSRVWHMGEELVLEAAK